MNHSGTEPLRAADPVRIGAYRLVGRLGEGGMGTVYLALTPAERAVAIKVVKAEFTVDENFAVRFHSEVDNARRVASFCTAQVLDNGNTDDGRPYMVTEYIAGTPLSQQISQYGALDPGPLHGVALGVAAALAAIHVAGLVHRDLKPSNVILSMSGPRVIDFGISRALDASTSFTRSGELLGSPGWWAPEQVRGDMITPAADVFAWGCLVAYAGNGRHPYGRGDVLTMAARVLNTAPDLGTLPAPLDDLARRATDPDPARRPTAQEMLLALVSGGIPSPTPMPAEPATLVATELLNESWQPPANIADLARNADLPDTGAFAIPATPNATDTPTPRSTRALPLPSPVDQTTTDTSFSTRQPVKESAWDSTREPVRDSAWEPVGDAETGVRRAHTDRTLRSSLGELTVERIGAPPPAPPKPPRRLVRMWLIPALAVAAALVVTVVVLTLGNRTTDTKGLQTAVDRFAAPTAAAGGPDTDIGRRVTVNGPQVQFIVPQAPRCGLTSFAGATATNGEFCVVRWTLLNLGGVAAPITATPPKLIDDRNAEHAPEETSNVLPRSLAPGARVDGVFVFQLQRGRAPAHLLLPGDLKLRL